MVKEWLNAPTAVIVDSNDVVYVAEFNNYHVSVLTCEGKFLMSFHREAGQFMYPCGISV